MAPQCKRVAAIGECMIELVETASGGEGGSSSGANMRRGFGGDTLNMAVYMARVGHPDMAVDYITALGTDPFSDEMVERWQEEGIGTGNVVRLPDRLPGLYVIRTDTQGERTFLYWRSAAAARELLKAPHGDPLLDRLSSYDLLYLSGISLAILDVDSRERLISALARARRSGTQVAVDTNYRPRNWSDIQDARDWMVRLYAEADIVLPSFEEQALLFGDTDPDASVDRLLASGVGEAVIKCGPEPCLVATPQAREWIEGAAVESPVDTTAAGDSFNAAYLAGRLLGQSPSESARAGHRLAGTVIQHRGAIIPGAAMPPVLER